MNMVSEDQRVAAVGWKNHSSLGYGHGRVLSLQRMAAHSCVQWAALTGFNRLLKSKHEVQRGLHWKNSGG